MHPHPDLISAYYMDRASVRALSDTRLRARIERLGKISAKVSAKLIAAGRGTETNECTWRRFRAGDRDILTLWWCQLSEAKAVLYSERDYRGLR